MEDIDVVITWVDGNDPEWKKVKNKYTPPAQKDSASDTRYRDWDNLQYVLRGIEQNMPWVRRVHLVTWGHIPKWLNTGCSKLNIVRHEDFIPAEYLPTFNSNAIELNLHRIEDLAERFICFNDDMFVVKKTCSEDFFMNGLPKDMACISPQPIYRSSIMNIELNNMKIINDYFSGQDIKDNRKKWLNFGKYGQYAVRTAIFLKFKSIIGIFQPHVPYTLMKSTYETLWQKEYEILDETCKNKFRTIGDVNVWLLRSWQLLSGDFEPRSYKFGQLISASDTDAIKYYLGNKSGCRVVCINDDASVTDFEQTRDIVNSLLAQVLPDKSSFELEA